MLEGSNRLRLRLRRWLQPLIATPLHPQWLVARQGRRRQQWVANRAAGAILDVGCAGSEIQRSLPGTRSYVGLDYPATASNLYRTRPHVYGNGNCLPFSGGIFDTVLMLDVLEHLQHPEAALLEAARVLRPGGILLVTIPFAYPLHDEPHDYQRFTTHGLRHRLANAGLCPSEIHAVGGGATAACAGLAMSVAQGVVTALSQRGWRVLLVPVAAVLIPSANLLGWAIATLFPANDLFPGAYYVQARKDA